ncbi:MAG TPA: glycosyltransferase family A protein [Thermoanaerobaculia bacterium]
MSGRPLVSVVTIFFNAGRFLPEAVESVLAQTYPNWELLLVDDGSTDGSRAIAEEHAARFPGRVRCLEHPGRANRGMSASRNLGLRHARGELIAFLDADDVWLPEKLERQVEALAAHPEAALVYGATHHWYGWTGRPEDAARDHPRKLGVPPGTLVRPPDLVRLFLGHAAWTPGTCGVLIRREAVERAGGFEESFRGLFEDQVFFYKLLLEETAWIETGSWDLYRQHPESRCEVARREEGFQRDRLRDPARGVFLAWLERYLDERGIADREVRRLLRKELRPYRHPRLDRLARFAERRLRAH